MGSTRTGSYREILRSSTIIGGASAINIVVGLARTKIAALVLGPAGIGLIGLLQSLIATGSAIASLGFGTAGARQVAEANGRGDSEAIGEARRSLMWGTLLLALVGGGVFWCLREALAARVLDDSRLAPQVGWLALGVAFVVAAGYQRALLTGLRRIADVARASVYSALLATGFGVGAILIWGEDALVPFVLSIPAATLFVGSLYVARLPQKASRVPFSRMLAQWKVLAELGVAFMLAGLASILGQLLLRNMVMDAVGEVSLGYFQAAWAISMTYVSFILAAMGQDYYPRLTAAMSEPEFANQIVNEQTEVALLLSAPILLCGLALAPWVIGLLYSSEFLVAADILRWQILGDVLKVASYPMGFIIIAAGDGRTFICTESLSIGVLLGATWIGLPLFGVESTGIAFIAMYVVNLPVVYALARWRTGFAWSNAVWRSFVALCFAALIISACGHIGSWIAALVGIPIAVTFGVYSLMRLSRVADISGPLGRVLGRRRREASGDESSNSDEI